MEEKILIVEDEFIVANDLRLMLTKAGYSVCGIAASEKEARQLISRHRPTWVLLDIFLQDDSRGTDIAAELTASNIGFIYISANTNQTILEAAKATQPYGFLVKPFREKDLLIMLDIAMEKHQQNLQFALQRKSLLVSQINFVANLQIDAGERILHTPAAFQPVIPFDLMKIGISKKWEKTTEEWSFVRVGFDEYEVLKGPELPQRLGLSRQEQGKYKAQIPEGIKKCVVNGIAFRKQQSDDPGEKQLSAHFRLESKLCYPIQLPGEQPALLSFYSRKADEYTEAHLGMLDKAAAAVEHLLTTIRDEGNRRPDKMAPERKPVTPEKTPAVSVPADRSSDQFDGIVGNCPSMVPVLDNINLVASTNISVLILGESGTGKERVAQCIHKLSARKNKPIVVVNCAALPHELIESELFGHEKGAFTGALEKRSGKFELADGGTIFLDEIGELPLDAQVKLLRVLQEKEIEHVGGSHPIKVDVRVIAATNRRLEKEVAEGRFRLDLYYRLNVFPIELPPLRERKEDIPLLAQHFVSLFSKEMGKNVTGLSHEALKQLESYRWPGNIRELGHLLERSVLMTKGPTVTEIKLPVMMHEDINSEAKQAQMKTLEAMEAEHILGVLKNCNGKVCGTGGAAEVLGLPPSTLNSKIKKLGIKRELYFKQ